jgi:hypothetical protein
MKRAASFRTATAVLALALAGSAAAALDGRAIETRAEPPIRLWYRVHVLVQDHVKLDARGGPSTSACNPRCIIGTHDTMERTVTWQAVSTSAVTLDRMELIVRPGRHAPAGQSGYSLTAHIAGRVTQLTQANSDETTVGLPGSKESCTQAHDLNLTGDLGVDGNVQYLRSAPGPASIGVSVQLRGALAAVTHSYKPGRCQIVCNPDSVGCESQTVATPAPRPISCGPDCVAVYENFPSASFEFGALPLAAYGHDFSVTRTLVHQLRHDLTETTMIRITFLVTHCHGERFPGQLAC